MKVLFLAVNCSYSHTSLAAWCLRATVDESVLDWQTLEVTIKDDPAKVLDQVMETKPDVIAATLYLFNHDYVVGILKSVRALRPDSRIVVGGPECLGENARLTGAEGFADIAVRGEGERALPQLLDRWQTGRDWDDIPGLCGTGPLGIYRDNGTAELVEDLDSIPAFYLRELVGFRKPFIQLESSRGCVNGCLFCTSRHTVRRFHSFERVHRDLQAIAAAGVKDVRIVDRTFNEDRVRALRLTRMFRDEFPLLRFHLEIEPARFNQELAEEFAKARQGQFHVEAGIQSLNPEVSAAIERGATVNRSLEGLKRLCGLPTLEVHVDLIAGLPGSKLSDILSDLKAVMNHRPAEIQLERLKLLAGTPLAQTPAQWGLISNAKPPYQVLKTPTLSPDDLAQSDRLSMLLDWYYNTPEIHSVFVEAVAIEPSLLARFEEWGRGRIEYRIRPSLESRFESLHAFLQSEVIHNTACGGALEPVVHRLQYRWLRLGFSARNGLCPAVLWKKKMPSDAVLVEGDAEAKVLRTWQVNLEVPHYFCYGTGTRGQRAVIAVYRSSL